MKEAVFDLRHARAKLKAAWPLIGASAAVGALLAGTSLLLLPRQFESSTSFVPSSLEAAGGGTDILRATSALSQAGLGSVMSPIATSDIYPDIVLSTQLLLGALSSKSSLGPGTEGRTFLQIFGFSGPDSALEAERAVMWARKRVVVAVNRTNGLVTLRFGYNDARITAAFLSTLMRELSEFNQTTRQTQARSVREFLEKRLWTAKQELAEAEQHLIDFRTANVRYANSPRLSVEEVRLQREVRLAESVYQTLTQQYELARINEARDTPVITVVDPPRVPRLPTGSGPVGRGVAGAGVGVLLAAAWAVRPAWKTWTV